MSYYSRHHSSSLPPSFIVILIAIIIILWIIATSISHNLYNNGICPQCGGTFVYQSAIGHHYTTEYIYICDKCGNMIKTNEYYKNVNNET